MASNGYAPLASSIVTSSIWAQPDHVLRVWIAMLALKDRHDIVRGSVPGMAHLCGMTREKFLEAETVLISPEPPDPTKPDSDDGRRLERIDGGWFVINGARWREQFKKEARAAYKAAKEAERRIAQRLIREGRLPSGEQAQVDAIQGARQAILEQGRREAAG